MKLHVLFAQRKERYPGEYAPEALTCMTEHDADSNPEYLDAEKYGADSSGEFSSTAIVTLEFNSAELERILNPTASSIKATIVLPG